MPASDVKFMASLQTATLERDMLDENGAVLLAKGAVVILLPQTVAAAVMVGNGRSLGDEWPALSRAAKSCPEMESALAGFQTVLASYQGQLAEMIGRVTKLELARAEEAAQE